MGCGEIAVDSRYGDFCSRVRRRLSSGSVWVDLGAFTSPDAHVDVFRLVLANIQASQARGAQFHPYSKLDSIRCVDRCVRGVRYRNTRTGEEGEISCEVVINAAGGWAQSVAALAGVEVPVRCDTGTLPAQVELSLGRGVYLGGG